ncbi:hypothetical protein [Microbacterium aurum]
MTLIEPGGARTSFSGSSLQLGTPMPEYDDTPAAMVRMFREVSVPVPGDPAKVAAKVIQSVEQEPAPLRLVLGSHSYQGVTAALRGRLPQVEPQGAGAAETDADE